MATSILPKIVIEGYTSNEPFVKFTQKYEWTGTNPCLSVVNGYTDLNGILINGNDNTNTIVSKTYSNISFGITGDNANFIFKKNTSELLKIANNGNVGIGITNLDIYKLNIGGSINASEIYKNGIELNNIYLLKINNYWLKNNNNIYMDTSCNVINIGIGTSTPYANLHIYGSKNNNTLDYTNDGTLIISRYDNSIPINSRNFKFGYKNIDYFTFGNYNNINETPIWLEQFSIHAEAPNNSLTINATGNIGISTNADPSNKVNINGSLNASSLSGSGTNITNINYNNITLNKPELSNLNNWIYKDAASTRYIYTENFVSIGSTTIPNSSYKLHVNGNLNVVDNIFINGVNISSKYLLATDAISSYVTKTEADNKYYFLITDPNTNNNNIFLKDGFRSKVLQLGISANNISGTSEPTTLKNMLIVYGNIDATSFSGNGRNIANINYTNITGVPDFIQTSVLEASYFNKTYMNTTYHTTISNITYSIAPTKNDFEQLKTDVNGIYANSVTTQLLEKIANDFNNNSGLVAIYFCNLQRNPIKYNNDGNDINIENKWFGFGKNYEEGIRVDVNGIVRASNVISHGSIIENGNTLSNIYISSNVFNNIAPLYDTIFKREIAMYEYENIYPPQNTLFNSNNNTIITNSPFGNGYYEVDSSIRLKSSLLTFNSIFNTNENGITLSEVQNDYIQQLEYEFYTNVIGTPVNTNICTRNLDSSINIFGHWIQLYYAKSFAASKIVITVKFSELTNAPKKISIVAFKGSEITPQTDNGNVFTHDWKLLIHNRILNISDYVQHNLISNYYSATIEFPSNTTEYYYYRLIVTQLFAPISGGLNVLKINQIKYYGYQKKQEWRSSGSIIYSYSNISIKTIDDNSPYALNVNGIIYSSNNIYARSNIGIGTTNPLGTLHIGSITNSNDSSIIISKHDGTIGRMLKMGYDSNFNFTIGDYGSSGSLWNPQFYIHSNAPLNSLIINSSGNIGIGTTIHIDTFGITNKLSINGSTYIKGSLNQEGITELNKFSGDIYASNTVSITSNLNAWRVYASNINTTDYINSYGVISSLSNIGIGQTTSLLGKLHIQSTPNSISIWNSSLNLSLGNKLKTFIGSNLSYGFYNNYNYNNSTDYNSNYLSWNTVNNDIDVFNITSLGNIGIGITNPTGILQVGNGNKFLISSINDDEAIIGLNANDNSNTKIHLKGIDKSINYYASNHIYYNFQKNEKIRIDNNGNIGIGTTILTDTYKLSVNGSIYSSDKIDVFNSISIGSIIDNSDGNLSIYRKDTTSNFNNIFKFGYESLTQNFIMGNIVSNDWKKQIIINSIAPSNSLYIDAVGRIGINNLNPLGTLHLGSNSDIIDNNASLVISQKNSTGINRNFKIGYNESYDFILGDFGNNSGQIWKPQFYINSNAPENSLTINSLGNIGIGTINTNTEKLIINGETKIIGSFIQSTSGPSTNNLFIGNVGIATSVINQDFNLNVNGTANISGGINTSNLLNSGDLVQNGIVKIGTVSRNTNYGYNFYVNTPTCIEANTDIKGTIKHLSGEYISHATSTLINSNIIINGLFNLNSNLGINIGSNTFTNVLQVEDGGKLRISNDRNDYTCIGTSNIDNSSNTRIIINGTTKSQNPGNIEYYATSTGKHIFYSEGSTELMKIDYNGPITMNKELHVSTNIKENNNYLSDTYVKLNQLSNLSVINYNLNKKYGYIASTSSNSNFITINGSNYYKFDIDLRSLKLITKSDIIYRNFNIRCFMNNGIFEMNGNIVPSILQYDIYMSSGQITTSGIDTNTYPNNTTHIYAIGSPENYKLSNLLPCHITLLRTDNFNYLSIISKISNLEVSYIIEDYLG
jgi:hypothetical protein